MLPHYMTEAQRIASLEGNVGRKVTRFLEELFPSGTFRTDFGCDHVKDLADHALFVIQMEKARANALALHADNPQLRIDLLPQQPLGRVCVIVTPLATPQTVREKQALLNVFVDSMRYLVSAVQHLSFSDLGYLRADQLEAKATELGDVQYTYLSELVKGNYTNIGRTGGNFLTLAVALNPAVEVELRTYIEVEDAAELA